MIISNSSQVLNEVHKSIKNELGLNIAKAAKLVRPRHCTEYKQNVWTQGKFVVYLQIK